MTDIYVGNKKYAILQKQTINNQDIIITENGNYVCDADKTGFGVVRVQVPESVFDTLTVTPSTSSQTLTPQGIVDGFNEVNVNPVTASIDSNIKAGNIKKDITILGVTGTLEFTTEDLSVTPSTLIQTFTPTADGFNRVTVNAVTHQVDANIQPENIKQGITILGVNGNCVESVQTTRNITENGLYTPPVGYTGFSEVDVDVKTNQTALNITPTTSQQIFTATDEYSGYTPVVVNPVTSAIDANIRPENIKNMTTILGVTGNLIPVNNETIQITSNGVYTPSSGHTGFSEVEVDINTVHNQDITINSDGVYTPDQGYTGFGQVTVNTSGTLQPVKAFTVDANTSTTTTVTPDNGYAGMASVTVDLSWIEQQLQALNAGDAETTPELEDITVTQAGAYTHGAGYDGLGTVTVNLDWVDLAIASVASNYTNTTVDGILENSLSQLNTDALSLRDYACYGMSLLTEANLTSCESIGSNVFVNTSLQTLTISTPTMCTLSDTTLPATLQHIYVPSNLVNTYKGATNWQTYSAIISAIA